MATISLMKYVGIPQVIDKQPDHVQDITGTFRQPLDYMDPVVDIQGSGLQSKLMNNEINYFEIGGRYYYLINWEVKINNVVSVTMHLDVLKTYKDDIDELDVTLERSSNPGKNSMDLKDDMMPLSQKVRYEVVKFPNEMEDDENSGTYILVTNQSGYTTGG